MRMKTSLAGAALSAVVVLAAATAAAQVPSPGQAGLNAALTKLFGDFTAFSARTEVRLKDQAQHESMTLFMDFALLGGNLRAAIDLAQIKSKDLSPEALANLKQIGMDKMITVVRPAKKTTLVVYPALKAYAEIPLSKQDVEALDATCQIQKTRLGAESVDGHPCEKHRVTLTSERGDRNEAIVWYATDLKRFPIQMQLHQPEAVVVMVYRNVTLDQPDPKGFEAPAGYARHASVEQLMQAAIVRPMGQGLK